MSPSVQTHTKKFLVIKFIIRLYPLRIKLLFRDLSLANSSLITTTKKPSE
jgi:hypothetical protein